MASGLHQTSGRWQLGLLLTLITCVMWTVLPIALKLLLKVMDPVTITWYRFLMSAVLIGAVLAHTGGLPRRDQFQRTTIRLLAIAAFGLYSNYLLFLYGLDRVTPGAAQILIQSGPVFLLIGSLIVFREEFSPPQWIGFAVLTIGMLLFFNRQLNELFSSLSDYTIGALLILLAAIVWAAFSLAQKQLLRTFTSGQLLFLLCVGAVLFYSPAIRPATITQLNNPQLAILIFCGFNLVFAYGCFTEALQHWEASRISATLSLIPLTTLGLLEICDRWLPSFGRSEELNLLGWFGAALVVVGSMLCALARRELTPPEQI